MLSIFWNLTDLISDFVVKHLLQVKGTLQEEQSFLTDLEIVLL